ncbi:MAG: phosphate ABC transporter substrate-binding protein [Gammaproteobacteria bacterium]|nr:phosphate ABC transporter substrate-binding protein [Gammaproteobacteria bacterium]
MNLRLALFIGLFTSLFACSETSTINQIPSSINKTKLEISGSSTLAPLMSEIAKAYEQKHPSLRIDVQAGGSSRGLSDVMQGIADIGMVSKAITDNASRQAHLIARDGVTIIVHKDNPISNLDKASIENIYLGKTKTWSDLELQNTNDIVVISKAEGRSTLTVFLDFLQKRNSALKPSIIIGDNEQAIKLVSNNINAIAYVSTSTADYNIQQGVPIKTLSIDKINPIEKNIASGLFPIVRDLNLVTRNNIPGATKMFLDFLKTTEAQSLIKEYRFVPVI